MNSGLNHLRLQDSYIQSRSTAIEQIESTIAELGQIFTQLAQMVAEQRETVQRIDADTVDIASNVSGAQRELLKYYASISSNRWLMLKVFGVLIVFVSATFHSLCHKHNLTEDLGLVLGFHPRLIVEAGNPDRHICLWTYSVWLCLAGRSIIIPRLASSDT